MGYYQQAFNPNNFRWSAGEKLGMFGFGANTPQLVSPGSAQPTQNKTLVEKIAELRNTPGYADATPDEKAIGLVGLIAESQKTSPEDYQKLLKMNADIQYENAKRAQELGKESLGIASMYNQINKLPGTIASAFGGAGERELMARLYGDIPGIVSETYRTFPRQQIQGASYGVPISRYFG
jgi:hypothetical protein